MRRQSEEVASDNIHSQYLILDTVATDGGEINNAQSADVRQYFHSNKVSRILPVE